MYPSVLNLSAQVINDGEVLRAGACGRRVHRQIDAPGAEKLFEAAPDGPGQTGMAMNRAASAIVRLRTDVKSRRARLYSRTVQSGPLVT
jgi:hypothetical protein